MKKIYLAVALIVFLLPFSALAIAVKNQKIYTNTINNQYKIEGFFTGNTASNANINPTSSSLSFKGLTDGTMTFRATDLTGLNGNISIGVTDGNNAIAVGNGEVAVSISDLKNASSPVIQASANAATQGDLRREALQYSYPIDVADKTSGTTDANKNLLNTLKGNNDTDYPPASDSPSNRTSGNSGGVPNSSSSDSKTQLVPCDGTDCTIKMLLTMGVRIYNYIVGFGAILAIGAIVWAGFSYVTAAGDTSKMSAAKEVIYNAIIGIVVLAASALIVNTVIKWIGGTDGTSVPTVEQAGEKKID